MTVPAVAPWVPTYATYASYVTVEDFLAEPTGVDTTQLVPGGDVATNKAALARVIARASSQADTICLQVLGATVDVTAGVFRVHRGGWIGIPAPYTPLIQVNSVLVGSGPASLSPVPDLSGVRFEQKVAWVPLGGVASSPAGGLCVPGRPGWVYAQMAYVNGHANTLTSSSSLAGVSSLPVANPLGIFPGLPMTVYDSASTEPVTVASSYVLGSSAVPLTAPTSFAHAAGVSVSALPPFVRDAVFLLTASLIKVRGAEAFTMDAVLEQPGRTQQIDPGGTTEFNDAKALLAPLVRVR